MWKMDGQGLEMNILAVIQQHRKSCGCDPEILYANPADLAELIAATNFDDPQSQQLFFCGVRVVPNISTQPGHLYAGVKKARTVAHDKSVMEEK